MMWITFNIGNTFVVTSWTCILKEKNLQIPYANHKKTEICTQFS